MSEYYEYTFTITKSQVLDYRFEFALVSSIVVGTVVYNSESIKLHKHKILSGITNKKVSTANLAFNSRWCCCPF